MKQQHKNSLLALAVVAGLLSVPMTWMTIRGVRMPGDLGDFFNSVLNEVAVEVTGLNGHFTLFIRTPIWFVVLVAIAASVVQFMRQSSTFAIPQAVEWGTAVLAVAWIVPALAIALYAGKASIGMGAILGLLSAATPIAMLCLPTAVVADRSGNE
jgi:hypothetical protein